MVNKCDLVNAYQIVIFTDMLLLAFWLLWCLVHFPFIASLPRWVELLFNYDEISVGKIFCNNCCTALPLFGNSKKTSFLWRPVNIILNSTVTEEIATHARVIRLRHLFISAVFSPLRGKQLIIFPYVNERVTLSDDLFILHSEISWTHKESLLSSMMVHFFFVHRCHQLLLIRR